MVTNLGAGVSVGLGASGAVRDPAERLDFAVPLAGPRIRFDLRSEQRLQKDAFEAETALERERALWELAERDAEAAPAIIERFLRTEPDRAARRHALWLLLQSQGAAASAALAGWRRDDDPEVADWAGTLLADLTGDEHRSVYQRARVDEAGAFDQTLPLIISGYVLTEVPGVGMVEARLSPLWFESIMGRVMACTNQATIRTNLVIEKALEGLHPDGSAHYEIYLFRGASFDLGERRLEHHYLSLTERPFYASGTVEEGPSATAPIELVRVAVTTFADPAEFAVEGDGPRAERIAASSLPFVKSVRGRYVGWAAVNLASVLEHGTVRAGDVQLSNPTHEIAGPMTNARLYGLFRGKLADHSGSGVAEVNSILCHGTVNGEHDLHCDGTKVPDPFA